MGLSGSMLIENITILREAARSGEPIEVGSSEQCDMTREEFLQALVPAGVEVSQRSMLRGYSWLVWLREV